MTAKSTPRASAGQAAPVPSAAGRMPLGARRLLLVAALCVPVGLVAGPYVPGAQLLSVAGIVMVAVAVSYREDGPWFWRLSAAVTATGALWLAATAAYLASIIVAADSLAPAPAFAPLLFNLGVGFFLMMALCVAAAVTLRVIRARRQPRGDA